ncbi:MAG: hypothetical protein C5B51_14900 [Terriglobia bacterium]|nr:MAG: hypothetical protein C5B51_14900 [Terriglobia bacterium]
MTTVKADLRSGLLQAVPARLKQKRIRDISRKEIISMKRTQRAPGWGNRKILAKIVSWMRNEVAHFLIDVVLLVMLMDTIVKLLHQAMQV